MYNINDVYQVVEKLEETLNSMNNRLIEMEQQLNWLRSEEEVKRHWQQGPHEMINK